MSATVDKVVVGEEVEGRVVGAVGREEPVEDVVAVVLLLLLLVPRAVVGTVVSGVGGEKSPSSSLGCC